MLAEPATVAIRRSVPLLFVAGEIDPLVRWERMLEVAKVAGGRFELLGGVGHLPSLECPEKLADTLAAFASISCAAE